MPPDASLPAACYALLHEVRLRGMVADADREADRTAVETLLAAGLVTPARSAVRITARGRELHAAWARLRPGTDLERIARRAYERFLRLNRELVRICHDWQVRPGDVPNDHRDTRYDWAVVDRLVALDERAQPVVRHLVRAAARFDRYPPRLRAARQRFADGEHAWLTSPTVDSYHTVWMHLHEDLLCALGIDRADEPEHHDGT